jgi:RHS repeat-associated protein
MGAGTTRFAEHVYLGDIPIAVIKEAVATPEIHYVYADQINRPWSVTDTANQLRWRWETEPFGSSVEERDPAGLGDFAYNLRFPGQYYDQITRTHYNYFRDYSPEIGRYVESDPIGLRGGLNTYAYVLGNPISYTDPFGLDVYVCTQPAFGWMPVDHNWIKTDSVEAGMGGTRGNVPGNQSGDLPGDPVQVTDHSGRSEEAGSSCEVSTGCFWTV